MYGNNASADILTSDPPSPDKPNSGVAMFERKRFLYMEESTSGGALNAITVKRLVSPGEISVRDLHKSQKNFQNTWKIFLATNFPPAMDCKDYALIRRIVFYWFKVKFVHDPQLPHERKCNPKVASEWPENEEYLEALLSILIYFYELLMADYGGNIKNVKSPTIERETQEYFNRNDYISKFITNMIVESPSQIESIPVSQIVVIYRTWLSSVEGIDKQMHHNTDTIQREFCDHPIVQKKFLMKDKDGATGSLIRCRLLTKDRMSLEEGESHVSIFDDIDHTPPPLDEEPEEWWVPEHRRGLIPVAKELTSKKEDNVAWPNDDVAVMKIERKETLKEMQDELDAILGL
jgi:phage/plasmid-associated DNA primase